LAEDRSRHRQIGSEPDDNVGFKVGLLLKHECGVPASLNICNWLLLFAESPTIFLIDSAGAVSSSLAAPKIVIFGEF